ncbi:MAG: serine hydrolase domain-containing protein [Flavobacteriales bacterium]
MGKPYTLLVPLLVCIGCTTPTPKVEPVVAATDPLVARIDSFMRASADAGFNGSLLVLRDGKALVDTGYGLRDRELNLPNTSTTVHAIGSITKQFTAACILKLQEMGKLNVYDPMSKYLGPVPSDKSGITLHQLLTHSAGFPGAIGDDDEPIDGGAFTKLALGTPLKFAPGTGYEYSNVGYSLLGIIVEHVSGVALERFLVDDLLAPAGILHTGYRAPFQPTDELAIGYRKDGTRWGTMLDHKTVNGGPGWHLRGNGGMLSTTHDMADWVGALYRHTVLSGASVDSMFAPHVAEGEGAKSYYGYGWAIFNTQRGTRLITHNGGNGVQFADVLFYVDEGVTIVLMSNAAPKGMQDLAWEIGRTLLVPGYKPQLQQPGKMLPGVPDGPVGETMKALSAIIAATGSDEELKTWFADHFGPGFLNDFPMKEHVAVFKQLRTDIGTNTIGQVEQVSADEYKLELVSAKDGRRYHVTMQVRPSDSKISGLGVEPPE